MDLQDFCQSCQNLSEKEQSILPQFCLDVEKIFGQGEPNYQNEGKIISLFYGDSKKLGRSMFFYRKKLIKLFYEWLQRLDLIGKGTVEYVSSLTYGQIVASDTLAHYYFKSLDSVLKFINLVSHDPGGYEERFLPLKTVVILLWYGVDIAQIPFVKRADLNEGECSVAISNSNGGYCLKLEETYFSIIQKYANAFVIYGSVAGRRLTLSKSEYLMRTDCRFAQFGDHMTEKGVRRLIVDFDKVAERLGHSLSVIELRKNGVFCRAYQFDKEGIPVNQALEKGAQNTSVAITAGMVDLYLAWKQKNCEVTLN